jgi:hypothetical protein
MPLCRRGGGGGGRPPAFAALSSVVLVTVSPPRLCPVQPEPEAAETQRGQLTVWASALDLVARAALAGLLAVRGADGEDIRCILAGPHCTADRLTPLPLISLICCLLQAHAVCHDLICLSFILHAACFALLLCGAGPRL